ncbi:Uncharacterised protein [Enterococcus saccharolyticus]|nr:Uncharacterised protein [Enterococcus saccharolyticus]VTS13634.1 Uncharacterised protein [Enterococcus casseliflavus]
MIEEELSVLNRIKEWAVLLKIYYGILFFSFVTVGLVSLLLTLLLGTVIWKGIYWIPTRLLWK